MFRRVVLWLWQLPQHLLGLLLVFVWGRLRVRESGGSFVRNLSCRLDYKGCRIYAYRSFPGGICCGRYILVGLETGSARVVGGLSDVGRRVFHEWGHSRQSLWWGPFYLFVPGLWSLLNNLLSRVVRGFGGSYNYYGCWVERQADRLGGVER